MFSELTIEMFCRCLAEDYKFKQINEKFVSHQLVSPQVKTNFSKKLNFARSVLNDFEPYCGKNQREKSIENLFAVVVNERFNEHKVNKFSPRGKEIAQQISKLLRSLRRDGYSFIDNKLSLSDLPEVKRTLESKTRDTAQHILIITFLGIEYSAVKALFFSERDEVKTMPGRGAARQYLTTELKDRSGSKLLITLLLADMGNPSSSLWATRALDYFEDIQHVLVVGIAGGVPDPADVSNHVRLGDVVISNWQGVIQYDMVNLGRVCNSPRPPCPRLEEFSKLVAVELADCTSYFHRYIALGCERLNCKRPDISTDLLHSSKDPLLAVKHPYDERRKVSDSLVFSGAIASSNELLRDPVKRDNLKKLFKVKAVEMEGAGVAEAAHLSDVGYFIVRGVVDYCDTHKNKRWHQYAAITAASYVKCLVDQF